MIDWGRVKELRSEIGAEDFQEVVDLFLQEADEAIARLGPTAGPRALAADLHFLKGAALNLGFVDLSALCQDGERRASAGQTDIDIAAVRATYRLSRQTFISGAEAALAA